MLGNTLSFVTITTSKDITLNPAHNKLSHIKALSFKDSASLSTSVLFFQSPAEKGVPPVPLPVVRDHHSFQLARDGKLAAVPELRVC